LDSVFNVIIDIYSLVIVIVIGIHASKSVEESNLLHRLYFWMLMTTLLMLTSDALSWFEGRMEPSFVLLSRAGSFVIFSLNTVIPSLYFLYVHRQVYHSDRETMRWGIPLMVLYLGNFSLLVASQFTGWYYSFDDRQVYHRGPLFWVGLAQFILITASSLFMVVFNKKQIERRNYVALVFFPVPPSICILLQLSFPGTSLMLHGLTLSLLIVFFSIQSRTMQTDYLTGAYNRKKLESYLRERIEEASAERSFSAIMIDLDNFKFINDTYGHDMGDKALEAATVVLRNCLRTDDLIARFGGDEFYVVLNGCGRSALEATVERIEDAVRAYNQRNESPFQLGFSMGYAVFDPQTGMKSEEFMKQVDLLMYQEKKLKRRHS